MDEVAVTAYGAAFAEPAQTAALLRARAAAAGLDPVACPVEDLMAAVVGAQAWLCALGETTLAPAGEAASAALAAVYCRAAGRAAEPVQPRSMCEAVARDMARDLASMRVKALGQSELARLSAAVDWVLEHGGDARVLVTAAWDLAAGWQHPALAAACDTLLTFAAAGTDA